MNSTTTRIAGAVTGGFFAGMSGGAALLVGLWPMFVLAAASAAVGVFFTADAVRSDLGEGHRESTDPGAVS